MCSRMVLIMVHVFSMLENDINYNVVKGIQKSYVVQNLSIR